MRFAVVVFPGSNCDRDCRWAVEQVLGFPVRLIWHRQRDLEGCDAVILPGGFAHGDYLRAGAIARFSPIMDAVLTHAQSGKPVIGICNGFQVLTEMGLLPGALLLNLNLSFLHRSVCLRVERNDTIFSTRFAANQVIELPIAHALGRYFASANQIQDLEEQRQILMRYVGPEGEEEERYNPNGSSARIAALSNREGNVLGIMPHPERRVHPRLGGVAGLNLFLSVAEACS